MNFDNYVFMGFVTKEHIQISQQDSTNHRLLLRLLTICKTKKIELNLKVKTFSFYFSIKLYGF